MNNTEYESFCKTDNASTKFKLLYSRCSTEDKSFLREIINRGKDEFDDLEPDEKFISLVRYALDNEMRSFFIIYNADQYENVSTATEKTTELGVSTTTETSVKLKNTETMDYDTFLLHEKCFNSKTSIVFFMVDKYLKYLKDKTPPVLATKKMVYPNGERYFGEIQDHVAHGQGKLMFPNMGEYTGEFYQGSEHGYGVRTYPNADTYNGQWFNGKKSGIAREITREMEYAGEFSHDKKHGRGRSLYKNNDVYDGLWENNARHGYGELTYHNGDYYIGDFSNDMRHGRGKMIYISGEKYNGDWKNGKRDGKGTLIEADGSKYEGDFKDDKKTGECEEVTPRGDRFRGTMKGGYRYSGVEHRGNEMIEYEHGKPKVRIKLNGGVEYYGLTLTREEVKNDKAHKLSAANANELPDIFPHGKGRFTFQNHYFEGAWRYGRFGAVPYWRRMRTSGCRRTRGEMIPLPSWFLQDMTRFGSKKNIKDMFCHLPHLRFWKNRLDQNMSDLMTMYGREDHFVKVRCVWRDTKRGLEHHTVGTDKPQYFGESDTVEVPNYGDCYVDSISNDRQMLFCTKKDSNITIKIPVKMVIKCHKERLNNFLFTISEHWRWRKELKREFTTMMFDDRVYHEYD